VRFASRDGVLVASRVEPGRGAYTCRRAACVEQAVRRRAFPRALRTHVRVDPELARLYTEEPNG
jgi:predicted RNA-binding protein YlxR (DUF448 family)